jgi:hypothetical protein
MCRLLLVPLAALATAALLGRTPASTGQQVRVVSIGDGDTISVQQGSRRLTVRLACIDAPEMAQRPHGQKARPHGPSGRLAEGFSEGVDHRPLRQDRGGDVRRHDHRPGAGGGRSGLSAPRAYGYVHRRYMGQCEARDYLAAEHRASRSRYGVWDVPGGIIRPWDLRRGSPPPLPSDSLMAAGPATAATGTHRSRWERRWRGLKIPPLLKGDGIPPITASMVASHGNSLCSCKLHNSETC